MAVGRMLADTKRRIRSLLHEERIRPPSPSMLFEASGRQFFASLSFDEEHTAVRASSLLRLLEALIAEVAMLDDALMQWSRQSDDARLLLTIPGVGWVLAAIILSQIGDISRFPNPRKLCAYAGLVPRVHQSGKSRRTGAISLAGRGILRHALYTAVLHARRRPGVIQPFYERLAAGRPKAVARVAATRKLLSVTWYMLSRKQPYRGHDEKLTARKLKSTRLRVALHKNSARSDRSKVTGDRPKSSRAEARLDNDSRTAPVRHKAQRSGPDTAGGPAGA
jgi:transposase